MLSAKSSEGQREKRWKFAEKKPRLTPGAEKKQRLPGPAGAKKERPFCSVAHPSSTPCVCQRFRMYRPGELGSHCPPSTGVLALSSVFLLFTAVQDYDLRSRRNRLEGPSLCGLKLEGGIFGPRTASLPPSLVLRHRRSVEILTAFGRRSAKIAGRKGAQDAAKTKLYTKVNVFNPRRSLFIIFSCQTDWEVGC